MCDRVTPPESASAAGSRRVGCPESGIEAFLDTPSLDVSVSGQSSDRLRLPCPQLTTALCVPTRLLPLPHPSLGGVAVARPEEKVNVALVNAEAKAVSVAPVSRKNVHDAGQCPWPQARARPQANDRSTPGRCCRRRPRTDGYLDTDIGIRVLWSSVVFVMPTGASYRA